MVARWNHLITGATMVALGTTAITFAETHTVTLSGFDFSPADLTIEVGDTVHWQRVSGSHTVSEGTDGVVDGDELFHSSINAGTPTFDVTFDEKFAGTVVDYFCEIHFDFAMVGTITVNDPIPPPTGPVIEAAGVSFTPSEVTIDPGTTVRWQHVDGFHTVTEGTDGSADGDELFNTLLDSDMPIFEFTFDETFAGTTVDFFCEPHFDFGMTGKVIVNALPPPPCPGDANGDGMVDPLDAGFVQARFSCDVAGGAADCVAADQNEDGEVDPLDSGFVLARFGVCPE